MPERVLEDSSVPLWVCMWLILIQVGFIYLVYLVGVLKREAVEANLGALHQLLGSHLEAFSAHYWMWQVPIGWVV